METQVNENEFSYSDMSKEQLTELAEHYDSVIDWLRHRHGSNGHEEILAARNTYYKILDAMDTPNIVLIA